MDWTRGLTIGRGSSATVSIATAAESGRTLAVKSAELSRSEIIQREQAMLSTLECPHIISQLGHDVTSENGKLFYNLFLEFAADRSVSDEIQRHGGRLDEGTVRSYTRRILLGVEHLHSNGIVHCDIKCSNILVTGDGPKIADFGCAKRVGRTQSGDCPEKQSMCGTPAYMAPEVARGEHQSFLADIWALGCTVIEMATGRAPWADVSDPVSALYRVGFSRKLPEIPCFMSKQAQDFLGKCLKTDPMERWSASELVNHDFVVGIGPTTCNMVSPTSILDTELWATFQESEWGPSWGSTQTSSLVSPIERIQKLAGTECPNWELNDTWVVVRSNIGESKLVEEKSDCHRSHSLDWTDYCGVNIKILAWDSLEYFRAVHVVPTDSFRVCAVSARVKLGREVPNLEPFNFSKDALNGSPNFENDIVFFSLEMSLHELNLLSLSLIFLYHLIVSIIQLSDCWRKLPILPYLRTNLFYYILEFLCLTSRFFYLMV